MSHYSDEMWADFARGVSDEPLLTEMQAHLDSGCADCQSVVDQLRAVVQMAIEESKLAVPEKLIRRAYQVFDGEEAASGWIGDLDVIVARMVVEAQPGWQPAGVRSVAGTAEGGATRLLYRAGDYSVDLTIEPPTVEDGGGMVGQIANDNHRREPLEGVLVQMQVNGQIVAETLTNQFGEFLFSHSGAKAAVLQFVMERWGKRIDVVLAPWDGATREVEG